MSEQKIDVTDPSVERVLTMRLAQKGFGIHPERDFLYMHMGNMHEVSFNKILNKLAEIHYEADFVVSSTTTFSDDPLLDEDNIYLVNEVSDELHQFLDFKSRAKLSEEVALNTDEKELIQIIGEALKKENFTRDENTKVFIYKIAGKQRTK